MSAFQQGLASGFIIGAAVAITVLWIANAIAERRQRARKMREGLEVIQALAASGELELTTAEALATEALGGEK
jgi:hypothetical protein